MRNIAIFGAGGLGRETAASLNYLTYENQEGWNFIGFFDDTLERGEKVGDLGVVLGGLRELNQWEKPISIALCLGYPHSRANIYKRIKNPLVSFPNLIHKNFYCTHRSSFVIGQGNIIQGGCNASTNIKIGDFNVFNGMIGLGHDIQIGSFNSFMPRALISGNVEIGCRNLFGANCFVVEKLKIIDEVVVGPLSVLMTKPRSGKTYIGNPAKMFKF